jgi:hypothetical protein
VQSPLLELDESKFHNNCNILQQMSENILPFGGPIGTFIALIPHAGQQFGNGKDVSR